MKVCVIGTGRMGKGMVKTLSPFVTELWWASRTPEKIQSLAVEHNLKNIVAVSYNEALKAEIIIPALWFRNLLPWAKENKERLENKILVDIVNPFNEDFSDFSLEWGQSAAEELQKAIPETKVVGAFKNTFFQIFQEPVHEGLISDVYVTSDNETAKKAVMTLLAPLSFRILDGGPLSNNRIIERFTIFEREMAIRYGNYPYVSNRLFGINI
ncbi:NAD(P)-binding domain-containing protein [Bacillus sp. BRMEA1]|uniref:NADPH-dependent F420 reductase n=1 Tax=Neobacillus endophyticus TaxID=2738405 RepID=UPI0015670ABC|nr:NAD(P)-binding domain-containing protein [Neobacillus endophyticus]NRD78007.1 NAD(P)-binding domain-containing protein [Neobacillus endophyticus]